MNFREIAMKKTTLANIMVDREKMSTEEIIDKYDGEISITEIEYVTMGDESFWAYAFECDGDSDHFAFAGYVLSNIFDACLEACEGDYEKLYREWTPLSVKLANGKTKRGQPITTVAII